MAGMREPLRVCQLYGRNLSPGEANYSSLGHKSNLLADEIRTVAHQTPLHEDGQHHSPLLTQPLLGHQLIPK